MTKHNTHSDTYIFIIYKILAFYFMLGYIVTVSGGQQREPAIHICCCSVAVISN